MMVLTIDSLGRVMLPEGIRQTLGLNLEDQLALEIQDGKAVDTLREERIQEQITW
jgi:bifunctional DNA-binding transcriptional regulator/antitoxin component of YhaV-PrlF toxin-antitoxin module